MPRHTNAKTIIITGPTAVGKTKVALALARKLNLSIISADSLQVYRKLDIGSAKPTPEELALVPHSLIDIVEPDEEFNANLFAKIAGEIQEGNVRNNRHTLICGGTGLFIEAFLHRYECSIPSDGMVRDEITSLGKEVGVDALFDLLVEKDPEYAARITRKDRQKIVRALEVERITGKPFSSFHQSGNRDLDPSVLYFVLNRERKKLYEEINKRVDLMMSSGFHEEVVSLLKSGYDRNLKPLKSIGYNELVAHCFGEMTLEEAVGAIKLNSRRLAKRQLTWHRRHKEAVFIDVDTQDPVEVILKSLFESKSKD